MPDNLDAIKFELTQKLKDERILIDKLKTTHNFHTQYNLYDQIIKYMAIHLLNEIRCREYKHDKQSAKKKRSFKSCLLRIEKNLGQLENLAPPGQASGPLSSIMRTHKLLKSEMKIFLSQIKNQKPGPKPSATYQDIVRFLGAIYAEGTGSTPRCCKIGDEYHGQVYEFIVSLIPTLKKVGINLDNDDTIGDYLVRLIKNGSLDEMTTIAKHITRVDIL